MDLRMNYHPDAVKVRYDKGKYLVECAQRHSKIKSEDLNEDHKGEIGIKSNSHVTVNWRLSYEKVRIQKSCRIQ